MKEVLVVPSWSAAHEICENDTKIVFLKLLKENEVSGVLRINEQLGEFGL